MELNHKNYKLKKAKNYIKLNKLILFSNKINLATKIKKDSVKGSAVILLRNSFIKKILQNSIYLNLIFLINGLTSLTVINHRNSINFKNLIKLDNKNVLIAVKLNDKIYSPVQLNKLKSFNYIENISNLHGSLKNSLVFPSKKFISK